VHWLTRQGAPEGEAPDALSAEEVRRRATGGAALLVARGVLILGFGVGANIALARLLEPRDFGVVALGSVLLVFGSYLSDGGLGSGLIRRAEQPTRAELEGINFVQISITIAFAAIAAGAGLLVGGDGVVVAAMVATLPITILKVPSIILLERELRYQPIATVDVIEAVVFYAVALIAVAAGMGVWGFAVAMAARAIVGTATMARIGPVGLVRPRWSWVSVRPLLRFGAKFQAVIVVNIVREQGLNVGIAVVAGVATLGVWNLTWRVLQVPFMVFGTLGRIGYPTMARLLGAGHDPRPVIERGVAAIAILTAGLMVALVGFAPALPVLVGEGWGDVPATLLWTGVAMMISTPVYLGTSGYLFAADEGGRVLATALVAALTWLAVALSLVSAIGAPAAGIGWCASSLVVAASLGTHTARRSGAAVAASLAGPTIVGVASTAAGWLLADAGGRTIGSGLLGLAAGELLLLAGLVAFARSGLRDTRLLLGESLGSLRGRLGRPRVPLPGSETVHAPTHGA
jgi:polysaccharide transporter, PST family